SGRKGTLVTSCCRASRLAMLVPSTNAATRRSRDLSSRRSQTGSAASTRYASLSGSDSYRRYEPAKLVAGDTEQPKASAAAAAEGMRVIRTRRCWPHLVAGEPIRVEERHEHDVPVREIY